MEIRYDLALRQFWEQLKLKMENMVTMDQLNERLFEKLHKREFEKHYERLDSICKQMENRVESAIPALKYNLESGMRGKADSAELKKLQEEKASKFVVDELVKRINKLEEKIKFEMQGGADKASLSGSSVADDDEEGEENHNANAIVEEENEDDDDESEKEPKAKAAPKRKNSQPDVVKKNENLTPTAQPVASAKKEPEIKVEETKK